MPDPTAPAPLRPHQEWHRLLPGLDDCLRVASEIAGPALVAAGMTDEDRAGLRAAITQALTVTYDLAFQAGRDSRGVIDDADKLWAVHHRGSDDIIAQPDRATADKLVAWFAEMDAKESKADPGDAVLHHGVVVEWPFAADAHAAALARQNRETASA